VNENNASNNIFSIISSTGHEFDANRFLMSTNYQSLKKEILDPNPTLFKYSDSISQKPKEFE